MKKFLTPARYAALLMLLTVVSHAWAMIEYERSEVRYALRSWEAHGTPVFFLCWIWLAAMLCSTYFLRGSKWLLFPAVYGGACFLLYGLEMTSPLFLPASASFVFTLIHIIAYPVYPFAYVYHGMLYFGPESDLPEYGCALLLLLLIAVPPFLVWLRTVRKPGNTNK